MKYTKYDRDRKRQILSVIIGDKTNAGCFQKEADQYMHDDTPATPPADDKEYREFVEGQIHILEGQLSMSDIAIRTTKTEDISNFEGDVYESHKQCQMYMPRLIADIKKGVGI